MKSSTFEVYKEYSITQSGQDFLLLKKKKNHFRVNLQVQKTRPITLITGHKGYSKGL